MGCLLKSRSPFQRSNRGSVSMGNDDTSLSASTPIVSISYSSRRSSVRRGIFTLVVACFFGVSSSLTTQPNGGGSGPKRSLSPADGTGGDLSSPYSPRQGGVGSTGGNDVSFSYSTRTGKSTAIPLIGDMIYREQRNRTDHVVSSFREVRKAVLDHLQQDNDFRGARVMITGMMDYISDEISDGENQEEMDENESVTRPSTSSMWQQLPIEERRIISQTVDEAFQAFFARAFARPLVGRIGWERTALGIELLNLQLSSSRKLEVPYHTVPKGVLVQALAAVTGLLERPVPTGINTFNDDSPARIRNRNDVETTAVVNPDTAFRLLQRLVTGVGVRNYQVRGNMRGSGQSKQKPFPSVLYEQDFNRVLNVYSNLGKMNMAHRVIALQERTPHAPSLSPVTYSILVKGYGKLGDWNNIDMLMQHAAASKITPDTILFNSFVDAYINSNQLEKARTVFEAMSTRLRRRNSDSENVDSDDVINGNESNILSFAPKDWPAPNLRSYNIFLKGLALNGHFQEAQALVDDMKDNFGWWNHVTTNTLVQAAVKVKAFGTAQEILEEHTLEWKEPDGISRTRANRQDHPNVDAYTTLMDGYTKSGQLDKALGLLSVMKERKVEPNEYHYSCLIGGLARQNRIDQAKKMLTYVRGNLGMPRNCQRVLYNSVISGLIYQEGIVSESLDLDRNVDEAIASFRDMIQEKVMPDASTVAVILDGFGRCARPRVREGVTLVNKLERERTIPTNDVKVYTALMRVFAAAEELDGAVRCFRKIRDPDVAAINALIDAYCRCGNETMASETFDLFFRKKTTQKSPNVITYSTLIGASLKKRTFDGSKKARNLYEEMKLRRRIFPDKTLIDIILKGMIETIKTSGAQASDARFVAGVLRDASTLDWNDGQLERRKLAIETSMRKHVARAWDEEAELFGLLKDDPTKTAKDDIFERHGWNKVDSGFRLWGPRMNDESPSPPDNFLQSKGWNTVDSGFRII